MKLAADYRALARDALRGRWKTAVLAGLLASALGANIVNATENITSNANRANQNSNITPGGSLELFSQANGGRLLAVLVVCIVVWTLFTLVVGGAVRLVVSTWPGKGDAAWGLFEAAEQSVRVLGDALEFVG